MHLENAVSCLFDTQVMEKAECVYLVSEIQWSSLCCWDNVPAGTGMHFIHFVFVIFHLSCV